MQKYLPMRRFDYSFLKEGNVPARLVNVLAIIYSLRERNKGRFAEYHKMYESLEGVAKFQSVKSSNAIEGIATTDKRMKSILNESSQPLTHDEMEIAGYRDALNLVHSDYRRLDLIEEDILSLHGMIYSRSGDEHSGKYKTSNNLIVEVDHYGRQTVRFVPCSAEETPEAMEQLSIAYIAARGESGINDLLLIPCVILDFLCIHPFMDGNGRVSRLLSLLLLYKEDFDIGKYISFEKEIEEGKDLYYEALRLSSIGWKDNGNNYFPFVENFLSTLYRCYKELDDRFAILEDGKFTKKNRIEATIMNRFTPISKGELCSLLPDISVSTIEAVLGQLVKEGKIEKIGSFNGCRYIKKQK